jgi:hypothetical protein
MAYRRTAIFFPRSMLATSLIGLTFLPVARFSRCLLSNCSRCSLLKAARPERFPHRVPVGPGLSLSSCWCGRKFREWSVLSYLWLLLCEPSLLSFRRGPTPPQCQVTHFPQSNGSPDYLLCDLQLESLFGGLM